MAHNKSQPPPSTFRLIPKVINGGIAGIVGVLCTFPIDLVKTRLQNQQVTADGKRMYSGIADCFIKTFRNEGFFGMYRGCAVNTLLITPEKAIKLAGNDAFRNILKRSDGSLTVPREMLSGAGAATCQMIVTTPMELLKIQLQDAGRSATKDSNLTKKITATEVARNIIRERGFLGIYKGLGPTFVRDVTFSAIYFPMFAHLNAHGPKRKGSEGTVFYFTLFAGCLAGATGSFCATPFDVIKTRLQLLKKAKGEQTYSGILDCAVKVWKQEGFRAFFKGGLSRMLVVAPLFGIAQTVYFLGVAERIFGYPIQN